MRPALLALLCASGATVLPAAGVETWIGQDGSVVALVEDHRVPLVTMVVQFPAGRWSPWMREHHGESAFEIQIFDPRGELRERSDRLAADVSLDVGARASVVRASCLKRDLPDLVALVRDVLSNREFDRAELRRRRRQAKLDHRGSLKNPSFVLGRAVAGLLFEPGDPRRRDRDRPELPGALDGLVATRDVIVRLPGRVIGFAGDLTRVEADAIAGSLLPPPAGEPPQGIFPALAPARSEDPPGPDTTETLARLTQVTFGYARASVGLLDPAYPSFLVADHVLGGHFYSRLTVALRHEGGEAYGAGTLRPGDVEPGAYVLTTHTRAENAAVAEAKLRAVLREFHARGITEKERDAAIGFLSGRRAFSRQAPWQVLEVFLRERRLGLPEGFFDEAVARASTVSLDDINRWIAGYYAPASFTMVRVAPE